MLGRAPVLNDVIRWDSVPEFPVLVGFLVWRVEDGILCEREGHDSDSLSE